MPPLSCSSARCIIKLFYVSICSYSDETDSDCELDSADLPYVRSGPPVLNKQNDPSKDKQGKSQQRPLLNKKSNQPGAQQPAGSTCSPLSHKQLDRRRLKATEQSVQPSVIPRRLDSGQQVCGQHPAGQKETEPLIQRGGKKGSKPKRSLAGEMAGITCRQMLSLSLWIYSSLSLLKYLSCGNPCAVDETVYFLNY